MTKEEILKIAQECNLLGMRPHLDGIYSESLEAFAKLIAEKEREACADLLMGLHEAQSNNDNHNYYHFASNAIKELRGKTITIKTKQYKPQRTWVGLTELDCVGWFGYDTGLRLWFEADKNDDGAIPLYKNALEMANRALETKDATVQVSPLEFVEMVMEKEHLIGQPIFWAQWPNEEKK